jgi:hypothetical protein
MRKSLYKISINMYKYKLEYTKAVKGRIDNSMITSKKQKKTMVPKNTKQTIRYWPRRTQLKCWGDLRCSRRLISFCSTSGTCRVPHVKRPVIHHIRRSVIKEDKTVLDNDKRNTSKTICVTDMPLLLTK